MRQIRVRRGRRLAAIATALLVLGTACDPDDATPEPTGSPTTASTTSSPTPDATDTPDAAALNYDVWFAYGEHLFVVPRTAPATPRVATTAVEDLLKGPTSAESAAGVISVIPAGTSLNNIEIKDGIASVDLSSEYDDGGGSASMSMRAAQLVYTVTQFPTVDAVDIFLNGKKVGIFSGEGIVFDRPQRRKDYRDELPPVLLETPSIGAEISSPVTVSGTANVFEATVSIRVLDAEGEEIVRTFTTATCGTGCRGSYSETIDFSVSEVQSGTLEVFWDSPEDGSAQDVVSIPVTLLPG